MPGIEFSGFAGITLRASSSGSPDDPTVLIVHDGMHSGARWANVTVALVSAGRHVVCLDLRGHGGSDWPADGRYDVDALAEDVRAVLDQMASRPIVIASSVGAWSAVVALADRGQFLASGLVLVDTKLDAAALFDAARPEDGGSICDPRFLPAFDAPRARDRVVDALARLTGPVLWVDGGLSEAAPAGREVLAQALPHAEYADITPAPGPHAEERSELFNGVLIDFLERHAPRGAREFRDGSDSRTLRDAMGCFATGVTIVTAMSEAGVPVGLTVNSFTSVSITPPLLLVCIDKRSGSLGVLESVGHFAINVLHIGQQPISTRFAKRGEDKFADTPWECGQTGAPVLIGALATYECARDAMHDAGDHVIVLGRVVRARFEPQRDPLLYFRSRYRRLHFT